MEEPKKELYYLEHTIDLTKDPLEQNTLAMNAISQLVTLHCMAVDSRHGLTSIPPLIAVSETDEKRSLEHLQTMQDFAAHYGFVIPPGIDAVHLADNDNPYHSFNVLLNNSTVGKVYALKIDVEIERVVGFYRAVIGFYQRDGKLMSELGDVHNDHDFAVILDSLADTQVIMRYDLLYPSKNQTALH